MICTLWKSSELKGYKMTEIFKKDAAEFDNTVVPSTISSRCQTQHLHP
jgi:hypothetical protein